MTYSFCCLHLSARKIGSLLNCVSKALKYVFAVLIMIFFILPAVGNDKTPAKDVLLATVNGQPVTLLDVLADTLPQERQLRLRYSGKKLKEEQKKIREQALSMIIDRKLVYEQFKKKKYKVPNQILEKMLDRLAAELAGGDRKVLESKARKAGMTLEELREQARERSATALLLHERCYKPAYVTPKQVYDYYQDHKDEFVKPAELNIQILYLQCRPEDKVATEFVERMKEKIKNADENTFSGYVALHSQGPNRDEGGKVGWIREDQLREDFKPYLIGKPANTVAGPILTDEGYYFIRIMDRKEAQYPEFKDIKEDIRKELSKKEEDRMYKKYISFLKRDAVIRIIKHNE